MKLAEILPEKLDVGELVRNLLGLEPALIAVTRMDIDETDAILVAAGVLTAPKERDAVLEGLGGLMRRALEIVLELGDCPDLTLHFMDEKAARAAHFPDAASANLAMLLAYGFMASHRRRRALKFAPLDRAARKGSASAIDISARLRAMSVDELIAEYDAAPKDVEGRDFNKDDAEDYPISIAEAVETMLEVEPHTLLVLRKRALLDLVPETRARAGLERLSMDVLSQYKVMRERGTVAIRLMSESDAQDALIGEARAAQIATLLAAALHADETHDVFFLRPQARTAAHRAALRETAKLVYRDYSDEALRGLELICDGIVHFGHGHNRTIAERLLLEVARECDPQLQAMPCCVSQHLWLKDLENIVAYPTASDSPP